MSLYSSCPKCGHEFDDAVPRICLELSGNPRPAPRSNHKGKQHYHEAWYTAQKHLWGYEARQQMLADGAEMLHGRVGLRAVFYRATRRKADLDNLVKAAQDALNGIAYDDDGQIDKKTTEVVRGVGKDNVKTELELWELDT